MRYSKEGSSNSIKFLNNIFRGVGRPLMLTEYHAGVSCGTKRVTFTLK